jgi:1-acyl-sn-glycerol-3-phosphate acyltransferase
VRLSDRLTGALGDRLGERLLDRLPRPRLPRKPTAFPWAAPQWPTTVAMPAPDKRTGSDYDTEWSRRYGVRVARAAVLDGVIRPLVYGIIPPVVEGEDRLTGVEGPVIFAANHSSHLDTALLLSVLPRRFRHQTVVAGAADYFFDNRLKGALFAFGLGAIPIERTKVSRKFLDLAADLLADEWSILIYPEGGRSPDGWGQTFSAGAGYLAVRSHVPVVPIHVAGTLRALPKGASRLRPGPTAVTFGSPVTPAAGEDARRVAHRLEAAVAALADEFRTDWWQARRRAARGDSPSLSGPDVSPWRRAWARPVPAADRRERDPTEDTPWFRR